MAMSVPGGRAQNAPISLNEWISIMRSLHRIIEKQLTALERQANGLRGREGEPGSRVIRPADMRALGVLANAIGKVRVINDGIKDEQAAEEQRRELHEGRARQEELERRLARLAQSEEEA